MRRFLLVVLAGLLNTAVFAQFNNPPQRGRATQELPDTGMTAAHVSLPMGSTVRVVNADTGKEVEVTIVSRISLSVTRIIDLSYDAWEALGLEEEDAEVLVDSNTNRTPVASAPAAPPPAPAAPAPAPAAPPPAPAPAAPASAPPAAPASAPPAAPPPAPAPAPVPPRPAPVVSAPAPAPAAPAPPPAAPSPAPVVSAPAPAPVSTFIDDEEPELAIQDKPAPQTAKRVELPPKAAPPAVSADPRVKVVPALPCPRSGKLHRLQVGAYSVKENADNAERRLKAAGFQTQREARGNLTRVLAVCIPAAEVNSAIQRLGDAGFREVWIRE